MFVSAPGKGQGRGFPDVRPRYQAQEALVSFTKDSATLTQLRTSPLCFYNILSLRWLRDDTRYR